MMILIITLKTFLYVNPKWLKANRRVLLIAAVTLIIILVSVITIYLTPSDTIIPIPNPNVNSILYESSAYLDGPGFDSP